MVLRRTVTLTRLGEGEASLKAAWRFMHNDRVSEAALIAAAREHVLAQVAGRRVLVLQDTSEINFSRHQQSKSSFGRGGNGNDPAFFIHPALVVDRDSGVILGLADVQLWERHAPPASNKRARKTADKESQRWLNAANAAAGLRLAGAVSITVIADREGDLYPAFAARPAEVELLVRAQTDRALAKGGYLFAHLDALPIAKRFTFDVPAVPGRAARKASMELRFGPVQLRRPKARDHTEKDLPDCVALHALDVREVDAPAGVEPIHWRLLSSASIDDIDAAFQAIADYRQRWHIEQLFRTLKKQGLGLEESQITDAAALRRLALIALRAAVLCLQLVHARAGADPRPATAAISPDDIPVLEAIAPTVNGRTARLSNPFAPRSLAWAAWIIARLGGWIGARDAKPPGPITMHRGLHEFQAIAHGFRLRDVSRP